MATLSSHAAGKNKKQSHGVPNADGVCHVSCQQKACVVIHFHFLRSTLTVNNDTYLPTGLTNCGDVYNRLLNLC